MKTKDHNSITNQDIKGKFVRQHVKTCFSYEMDECIKKEVVNWEEIENMFYFNTDVIIDKIMQEFDFEGEKMLEYANDPDTFNCKCKTEDDFRCFLSSLDDDELDELCNDFGIDIDDDRSTPHEIFEWWIVSEYLYQQLKEEGYPVLDWGNNYYWGRCITGQAILLDYIISKICDDMEIFDGQKYSWAKSI